jgi:hypothetical protein
LQAAEKASRAKNLPHGCDTAPEGATTAPKSAHLVALVRAGSKFENGVLVERPDESTSGDTHAA